MSADVENYVDPECGIVFGYWYLGISISNRLTVHGSVNSAVEHTCSRRKPTTTNTLIEATRVVSASIPAVRLRPGLEWHTVCRYLRSGIN